MKLFVIFVFVVLFQLVTLAQQSINTAGGDATGIGGSIAYSIGQVVYTTNNSNSGSVAQGVQHAYEIFAVSSEDAISSMKCLVYPNPTVGDITLELKEDIGSSLRYQIFDLQGKLLISGPVISAHTRLPLNLLTASTYLLRVSNEEQRQVSTFKIVKSK
jgi:hypothetical protein